MKPGVFSVHLILKQEKFGAHALHAAHKNRKYFKFFFLKKKKRKIKYELGAHGVTARTV